MNRNQRIKGQIGKWLSIYTVILFVCLPIWEVVTGFEDLSSFSVIECEESAEKEFEDISEKKDLSEKDKIIQSLNLHSTKATKTLIHMAAFLLNNFEQDIQDPPPRI